MTITIFGWAMVVMMLTGGIVFIIDKQYSIGIIFFIVGVVLANIGFRGSDFSSKKTKKGVKNK